MAALDELVGEVVRERLKDVKIESVTVERDVDSAGEQILRVTVVFDSRSKKLDADKMLGMSRHLKSRLTQDEAGLFPMFRFVSKGDAAKLKHAAA